ncbi:MAG: hypothetical protein JWL93_1132 [Hyphomicrobiales bacterium]|nr:hypothetical protein [Hyphomicrobiales bacterium]
MCSRMATLKCTDLQRWLTFDAAPLARGVATARSWPEPAIIPVNSLFPAPLDRMEACRTPPVWQNEANHDCGARRRHHPSQRNRQPGAAINRDLRAGAYPRLEKPNRISDPYEGPYAQDRTGGAREVGRQEAPVRQEAPAPFRRRRGFKHWRPAMRAGSSSCQNLLLLQAERCHASHRVRTGSSKRQP